MKYQFKNAFDTIMIDRLTGIPEGAKILVYRLAFTAILLAEKYEVHFVTDDPEAKELFDQTVIGNGEFGNDDKSYLIEPSEEINKKENEKAWLDWSKSLDMQFSGMVINPPYAIGNKIIAEVVKHLTDDGKAVVIQPLSQYKNQKLFENIESFELADPKLFEDAVITENLNISVVTKNKQNKFIWQELVLESCDQNFRKFYDWNIANSRGIKMERKDSKSNVPLPGINIDTDFVESGRCFSIVSAGGFSKTGYGYQWNVSKQNTNTSWLHCAGIIYFNTKHEKDNFAKFWYSNSKGKSLISRAALGLHMVSVSADYYFFIPQIDWETIDQHPLWNTDVDAAVLDVMGLKWNEDKTVIIDK